MICPICKMRWNIGGCNLCGECPGCLKLFVDTLDNMTSNLRKNGLMIVEGQKDTWHICSYKPSILTEDELVLRRAEGTKCTK